MNAKRTLIKTFAISSVALFMVVLDNLVVSTALPNIRVDLGASLGQLEWTVNAYTLTFAVLLLTGAALGDGFGRKRMFVVGLAIFTVASAAAALAPDAGALIVARAIQGVGGAIVTPLSLTILSDAVGREMRGLALGAWSGVAGLAVAMGPVVGGAVVDGISWHWIFWLNVPIGLLTLPLAWRWLHESYGSDRKLDLPGVVLASAGLFGIVWGLVSGNSDGWVSAGVVGPIVGGAALVAAFVAWQLRAESPMLPLHHFRNRAYAAAQGASFLMYFGLFGSVFLMTQFFQTAQDVSPLGTGLRILPWTAVPMFVAPLAGILSDRIGGRPLMATGLALQAVAVGWFAKVAATDLSYSAIVVPFVLGGIGSAFFYAPVANVVLSSVQAEDEGKASGANNAIRELGGVFGVAILAAIFARYGGYKTPEAFVEGFRPALWIGAGFVAAGALAALAIPGRHRPRLGGAVATPA